MATKISTFARIRPIPSKKRQASYSLSESTSSKSSKSSEIQLHVPLESRQQTSTNVETSYNFKFDKVFDQSTKQETIFQELAIPNIESALNGYNSTIFAYGQTGSGKTFTITGGAVSYKDRGIIPRTLEHIFQSQNESNEANLSSASKSDLKVSISYIEIYNESGYDLLDEKHDRNPQKIKIGGLENFPKVQLMEDATGNISLRNMSIHTAASEEDALSLLFLGDTNRAIAETPMNMASTRSHCIFTIYLQRSSGEGGRVVKSKLEKRVEKVFFTCQLIGQ